MRSKLTRCFVSSIEKSAYNYRLLSNMIELADSCNIRVCCEGAETQTELRVLEDLHPSLLQGFLFSGRVRRKSLRPASSNRDQSLSRRNP